MEEYSYGKLFLKKSMAQELTLKSPRNATKTTRMTKTTSATRATRAARATRTTTHRGERRAFLGWQYAKAEVSNFQTNTGLMRYMTNYHVSLHNVDAAAGYSSTTRKSFIRDTFSSCNNGTAGGRDRQLDRQIGVTVVSLNTTIAVNQPMETEESRI